MVPGKTSALSNLWLGSVFSIFLPKGAYASEPSSFCRVDLSATALLTKKRVHSAIESKKPAEISFRTRCLLIDSE